MNIKTKYSVGDVVWVIHLTSSKEAHVRQITVEVTERNTYLRYILSDTATSSSRLQDSVMNGDKKFVEEKLFKTKALLLKSL